MDISVLDHHDSTYCTSLKCCENFLSIGVWFTRLSQHTSARVGRKSRFLNVKILNKDFSLIRLRKLLFQNAYRGSLKLYGEKAVSEFTSLLVVYNVFRYL